MRIGIDATALPPQPVGAGNYIIHLVRELAVLLSRDELVVFVQPDGRRLIDNSQLPVSWAVFPERSPAMRLAAEQWQLPNLARIHKIDLLHSLHYTRPYWLACPSVVTFHDLTFFLSPHLHTRSKRVFFPLAMRMSARRADALTAVSENTRRDAIRLLHIPEGKISTTPLGVDDSFHVIKDTQSLAHLQDKYQLPAKFILYVGLIEPRKNLPLLLKAYREAIAAGVSHSLVIVGGFGWDYEAVLQEIASPAIREQVFLLGYVPQEDLPGIYNLADLFVYPSLYEGFGLPVLEAMACGVPVIASATASLPEIAGEAAYLVSPGDQQALTDSIQALLTDASLRHKFRAAGIIRSSQFTWKNTAERTLQVYKQVLQIS